MFVKPIISALQREESLPDLWFVVIPEEVYQYCRPQSFVESEKAIITSSVVDRKRAQELLTQASFFESDRREAQPYYYDVDFHNQLKAKLLTYRAPTQVIREPKLFTASEVPKDPQSATTQLAIAWNLTSSSFYKAGGRPWKASSIREGVCYLGLVFKEDHLSQDRRSACCAAQMFVDSGDGFVFRGAIGPWRTSSRGEFHLSRPAARELMSMAIETYRRTRGQSPRELFVHGQVRFADAEWRGFLDARDGHHLCHRSTYPHSQRFEALQKQFISCAARAGIPRIRCDRLSVDAWLHSAAANVCRSGSATTVARRCVSRTTRSRNGSRRHYGV